MDDSVYINANICNRTYKIKVDAKNEATVRNTLQTIQQKINDFKTQFSGRDNQDYMAMVLLDFVTSQQNKPNESVTADVIKELEKINSILD